VTLSIIIVSYNVKKLLDECLASVARAVENISAEVFVVDNASTDNTVSELSARFPSFQFIQNSQNTGFAKANNQALALATGEFVLFLNPDTIVPGDCFEKCVAFMNGHPQAGALGVKMMNGNNEFLKESKRGLPTPMTSFWKLSGVIKLFPRSRIFARYYLGHLSENETHEVEVLSGAFFLARKKVLDLTGGFDERFFMYAEDIDLSWRILKAGYKNFYFADTSIIHYKGASTKKDFRYVKQFYLAMSQFAKKHYGRGVFSFILDGAIIMRGGVEAVRQTFRKKK
jgi:GT2 family glycosyltransferase